MKTVVLAVLFLVAGAAGQRCDSINASFSGGWRPGKTAPRDGTAVEVMETYGIAPWYGIFKWTRDSIATGQDGKLVPFTSAQPQWVSVDTPGHGVSDDDCLFWRPYNKKGKYSDPTGGSQNSVAYWCTALHLRYDAKKDTCK